MKMLSVSLALVAVTATMTGCSKGQALEVSTGRDVTLQKKNGVTVAGRLVEVKPDQVVVETPNGEKMPVKRAEIASLRADAQPSDEPRPAPVPVATTADRAPEYREVTIPAGTLLPIELQTAVSSETSKLEDPVRGTLRRSVSVNGVEVLPAGTAVLGHVTAA